MAEDMSAKNCKIMDPTPLPENPTPTMSYTPFQQWGEIYEELIAFDRGTLFPELDKPFYGRRGEPR